MMAESVNRGGVTPVVIRSSLPLLVAAQRLASGPVRRSENVVPAGRTVVGTGNAVMTPAGVIRPIDPLAIVNHTLPSGPAVMALAMLGTGKSLAAPEVGSMRPIAGKALSVNHRFPSGPAVIASGCALSRKNENWVNAPVGVICRMLLAAGSVNQRFPSAPAAMSAGPLSASGGVGANSVMEPSVVTRPILFPADSVNQRLPSGPATMAVGPLPAGSGNVPTMLPLIACFWIRLASFSTNHRFPSGPAVMPSGSPPRAMPAVNCSLRPPGVIRMTESAAADVAQRLPSGPLARPVGRLTGVKLRKLGGAAWAGRAASGVRSPATAENRSSRRQAEAGMRLTTPQSGRDEKAAVAIQEIRAKRARIGRDACGNAGRVLLPRPFDGPVPTTAAGGGTSERGNRPSGRCLASGCATGSTRHSDQGARP